jgi:hypothetical protein
MKELLSSANLPKTPEEIKIGPISAIIVNNHNEVLPAWEKLKNALLIHIDSHSDTLEHAPPYSEYSEFYSYADYAKKFLSVENFICAGSAERRIDSIYWYNPSQSFVRAYFRQNNGNEYPIVSVDGCEGGRKTLKWSSWKPENISNEEFKIDLLTQKKPIILDIDLDAIFCTQFLCVNPDIIIPEKIKRIEEFLKFINIKPSIISIAQSCDIDRDLEFTPRHVVGNIQSKTLKMLEKVYQQ